MFRRPIKPKTNSLQNRIRRRRSDDDDDDDAEIDDKNNMNDDPNSKNRNEDGPSSKKKTKKPRTTVVQTSFGDDCEETTTSQDSSKVMMTHAVSDHTFATTSPTEKSTTTTTKPHGGLYGKEALAQLKAEQLYQQKLRQQQQQSQSNDTLNVSACSPTTSSTTTDKETPRIVDPDVRQDVGKFGRKEEEYLAFRNFSAYDGEDEYVTGSQQTTVLTGEDAFLLHESTGFEPNVSEAQVNEELDVYDEPYQGEDDDDDPLWEEQVTRRAGVAPNTSNNDGDDRDDDPRMHPPYNHPTHHSSLSSIQSLQAQIRTAMEQIRLQQRDLVLRKERRVHQIQQVEEELTRFQQSLQLSGRAHEYFQQLRYSLAAWVGALRDLQTKVTPIQEALYTLQAEAAAVQRWKDWESDAVAVLQQHGKLVRVLGRQPVQHSNYNDASGSTSTTPAVDEFGRSLPSQHMLARERRFHHLQKIQLQRASVPRGDESDAFLSDNEQEDFRERHGALQKALAVALEDLDEDFTKLQKLVDDFTAWYKVYPQEYKQCFTSLSLADLASVLVRVELCALNDPWDQSQGYHEGKWMAVIRAARVSGALDQAGTDRLIEKTVLPAVTALVLKTGINLCSKREVQLMAVFLKHVQHFLTEESTVGEKLRRQLVFYVQTYLSGIAIPIVRSEDLSSSPHVVTDNDSEMTDEKMFESAIRTATVGQMHRIKKVLTNVLVYWGPLLQSDVNFANTMLDFIGNKFLLLLSSLRNFEQPRFAASPGDVFAEVWNALRPMKWLENPDHLVASASIQAAAGAFGVVTASA